LAHYLPRLASGVALFGRPRSHLFVLGPPYEDCLS
jgi:hypothetical protein